MAGRRQSRCPITTSFVPGRFVPSFVNPASRDPSLKPDEAGPIGGAAKSAGENRCPRPAARVPSNHRSRNHHLHRGSTMTPTRLSALALTLLLAALAAGRADDAP